MRLVQKLVLAVWLAVSPVLAVHAYLSVQRELTLFRADMVRDLRLLGHVLRSSVVRDWQARGADEALALLALADQAVEGVEAQWIAADRLPDRGPNGDPLKSTQPIRQRAPQAGSAYEGSRLYVRVPVAVSGIDRGVIELSESLEPMHAYVRATILRMAALTIGMVAVSLLAAIGLGARLIGQRLDRVVEHARRIGAGDLSSRIEVSGRDEVAVLASHMNSMCMDLAEARSNQEQANAQRLIALDRLRHSERLVSVGRLASSIAHELGTPLNVVGGWAALIAAGELSPSEARSAAEIISREVKEMTDTARQVLSFVRREPGPKGQLSLPELTLHARGLLQPLANARRVTLTVANTDIPASIRGRRGEIEQVLTNLIVNAIEAMPDGGNVTIEICRAAPQLSRRTIRDDRSYLCLKVKDEGVGISEDDLPHIFEPFFTTKTSEEGTGIGLWLVDGIVRDHGGWIAAESQSGAGTCFLVYFPEEIKPEPEKT